MKNNRQAESYLVPRLIGVKTAAKEFGIAEHALRVWIKQGVLPCLHCGRKILINCNVLSDFLSCRSQPNKAAAVDANGDFYASLGDGKLRRMD